MTPSFPTRRSSDLLVERGPHDERTGSAYAIVEGVDGRTHHLRFHDMEMTGDAKAGSIVELRSWEDAKGHDRLSLATRSDIPLEAQLNAPGATWLEIGRASCRERVCQYVYISGVAVSLKKKNHQYEIYILFGVN